MTESTFSLPFVNNGEPFTVAKDALTPRILMASIAAKNHVLKEQAQGMGGLPEDIQAEVMEGVRQAAQMAQANTLLFHVLVRQDPGVRELGVDEAVDRIPIRDFTGIMEALGEAVTGGDAHPLADPVAVK